MALKTQQPQRVPQAAPPSYDVVTASRPQDEAAFAESATTWNPDPLTDNNTPFPRLEEKPVVIPRIDVSGRLAVPLPFMRAYSPDLAQHDINEVEFVAFIDNLAVAQAPPVPLQVLNVAGQAIGFVPEHWAMLAGVGMNVAAGVGTAAVVYGRTRCFLESVNREYFAPRGLQVSICKYQQLVEKLAIGPESPILADKDPQAGIFGVRDRCMFALQPHVANLSLDVPPPTGERNMLDRLAAKGIERKRRKQDEKHRKKLKQSSHKSDSGRSSSSKSSSEPSSDEDKAQKKAARRVRKIDHKAKQAVRKHPDRAAEIEEDRAKKVEQIKRKPIQDTGKSMKRLSKGMKEDLEKVKGLEFIVVEELTWRCPTY